MQHSSVGGKGHDDEAIRKLLPRRCSRSAHLRTRKNFPPGRSRMVIPFAAGGPTDVLGRIMAGRMSEVLGQQVVIENVGGAGGMTGSARVAKAAPDGYTFVLGTVGTHAQNQTLYKQPLYNAATDFTPVALIAEMPIALITRKDLPASNFKEFVAYAKANQAKMQFGSAGAGSATHLACVVLNYRDRRQHHPCALSRHRPGDAGSAGRPHRLSVRHHRRPPSRRSTAAPSRAGDPDQGSAAGAARLADRARAGHRRAGLYLERDLPAQEGAPEPIVRSSDAAIARHEDARGAGTHGGSRRRARPRRRATPQYLGDFVKSEIAKWAAPIKASGVTVD